MFISKSGQLCIFCINIALNLIPTSCCNTQNNVVRTHQVIKLVLQRWLLRLFIFLWQCLLYWPSFFLSRYYGLCLTSWWCWYCGRHNAVLIWGLFRRRNFIINLLNDCIKNKNYHLKYSSFIRGSWCMPSLLIEGFRRLSRRPKADCWSFSDNALRWVL